MPVQTTEAKRQHGLTLQERAQLSLTGVEDVERFDETEIVLFTAQGRLTVQGHDLRISKYSVESGDLVVQGTVDALGYTGDGRGHASFWARLFG